MIGPAWLGRIVNGLGEPIDGLGRLSGEHPLPSQPPKINPLKKTPVHEPLDVGVRAINGLLTLGRGQRVGLMAGSGVGKSVLLGLITRQTVADVVVVGLIGERGREVREFIDLSLGEAGLARAVVVVAPADESPLMRMRATELCHTIAAHYRDQGQHVLLLVDSLTRYAMAKREVALALGEPPATRGYPPSVFSVLPELVESAGNGEHPRGSMSAIYTVLAEGDDQQDPVVDTARAILDGHIVLSRALAERGHYPAIDVAQSISRCMALVAGKAQQQAARELKALAARFEQVRELMPLGAYVPGADPLTDRAVALMPRIEAFLHQGVNEAAPLEETLARLQELLA
jgi:flagellum-specific ATP synthase